MVHALQPMLHCIAAALADLQQNDIRIVTKPIILLRPELGLLYRYNCVRDDYKLILLAGHFLPELQIGCLRTDAAASSRNREAS